MVNLTIDNKSVCVAPNTTILAAAASNGITIPTLCYLKDINEIGACRICVVEVEGHDNLVAACNTLVEEGMVVATNTPRVKQARKINLQMILSQHDSQRLQGAVAVAHAGGAMAIVLGENHLQIDLAGLLDPRGVGGDHHAFLY